MAELLSEKWMKAMVVTTTVLGVVASVGSSRSSYYITNAQLFTALQADQWAYYQAKAIKQSLMITEEKLLQYKLLGASASLKKDSLNQSISDATQNISRYEQEKLDIKKKVEEIVKNNAIVVRRGEQFSLSVVFAQIGIMLSSVGVLLKRREMWYVGLAFGLVSLYFIANGFLLFL